MIELVLTAIGFAAAMTVPVFMTAMVESAASRIRPTSIRAKSLGVLVNGRTPRPDSFCAFCCEPIGETYVRDLTTRASYCDHECYVARCEPSVRMLQKHAGAS